MKDCIIDREAVRAAMNRKSKGVNVTSFRHLARLIDADARQVSRWMCGAPFSSASLAKLATVLKVHPGRLISLTERDEAYYTNNSA